MGLSNGDCFHLKSHATCEGRKKYAFKVRKGNGPPKRETLHSVYSTLKITVGFLVNKKMAVIRLVIDLMVWSGWLLKKEEA